VIVKTAAENARALHEGTIDAWYAPAPEIAFNWIELKLPGAPVFGLKLDSAPIYVAASKNTPGSTSKSGVLRLARWKRTGRVREFSPPTGCSASTQCGLSCLERPKRR
jgi:hypothetical protein